MFTDILLRNYKSFLNANIQLSPLTVLTGTNSAGKSSLIQALRIMSAFTSKNGRSEMISWTDSFWQEKSNLTRDLFFDIICSASGREYTFNVDLSGEHHMPAFDTPQYMPEFPLVQYLSAERTGPRDIVALQPGAESSVLSSDGSNTIDFIEKNKNGSADKHSIQVPENLRLAKNGASGLQENIEAWLTFITNDVSFEYEITSDRKHALPSFSGIKPTETGFGLSYVLPVITALLVPASDCPVLLVENPETHLHPAAQTQIARLIALSAAAGKQVLVETHSDHIIDGIRIAVKQGKIDCRNVRFYYFSRQDFEHETTVESPELYQDGKLSFWPRGFFDQSFMDKLELAK